MKQEIHTNFGTDDMKTIGRYMCNWEDNFKIDSEEIGCEDVEWILLA
jgi:hypothetical protein